MEIIRSLSNSQLAFGLLIAAPSVIMLTRYAISGGGLGQLLPASGEWPARLLIATLAGLELFRLRHNFARSASHRQRDA